MKWGNCCILCLNPSDWVVLASANAWKGRYAVPAAQCFSLEPVPKDYCKLEKDVLSGCVHKNTKLIIFAHGDAGHVDDYDAKTLAQRLRHWGVDEVGLIAVKACEVGKANYLDDLLTHFGTDKVGWLIGYKESTSTMGKFMLFGEAREMTTMGDVFWHFIGSKTADEHRVKIVKGGLPVMVKAATNKRPYYGETV